MCSATSKAGGAYLYANQQGCDGGRLYYDGCACVIVNGKLVKQSSQFSVKEVEVVFANVDLEQIDTYRGSLSSLRDQASCVRPFPIIQVDFALCENDIGVYTTPIEASYLTPEEEIGRGPACWLWDYLRRSGASGFLLPLSGGADSASVAAIVGCMCQMLKEEMENDDLVAKDVKRICGLDNISEIQDHRDLASRILTTIYMGTVNSSHNTRARAEKLAKEIGSYHLNIGIDSVISALTSLFSAITGKSPKFKAHGGSYVENAALQNIQARLRMVIAFLFAQLMPWVRSRGNGFLLVLGSGNVDEALRGYLTKYDCSSADLNPIGKSYNQYGI
jgi:NAD+ synthase (glutamine-hydrolysing)